MNKLELWKFRNEVASQVKSFHIKRNVINLNTHNSWRHEEIKSRICYLLKQQDKHFYTEVPMMSNYGKNLYADILVLDDGMIIEIMVSETLEQVKHKTQKYPRYLDIIAVTDWSEYFEGKYTLIRGKEI